MVARPAPLLRTLAATLALVAAVVPSPAHAASCLGETPLNVVLFLTDDMRFDGMWAMPLTSARLGAHGVAFERAYVTTPMCCPDRASMIAGGFYAHHTGVLGNELPNGGVTRFDDAAGSLPVRLQEAGYATGLVGKYLNGYDGLAPYIPPGWTEFAGWAVEDRWTSFALAEGSSGATSSMGTLARYTGYITAVQRDWAVEFVETHASEPFFLYLSFLAPHHPHTPAVQDEGSFADYLYRERGYDEEDVSDKPAWVQALPRWDADTVATADRNNQERLETLQAVDRAVVEVIDAVEAAGLADRTVLIFTSDNGEVWGEHRLSQKGVPYEESVRVPLIVSHPALSATSNEQLVAANLDLGATVQDLAGITPRTDGRSLAPVLCGTSTDWRTEILLQFWPTDSPTWAGIVNDRYKYTEYSTGENELYDLDLDPYELDSLHEDASLATVRSDLATTLHAERGLAIGAEELPAAREGEVYDELLPVWGGVAPYHWSIANGALPEGLALSDDGRVTGSPTRPGTSSFELQLQDSSSSPYDGRALALKHTLSMTVLPRSCGCGGTDAVGLVGVGLIGGGLLRRRRPRTGSGPDN